MCVNPTHFSLYREIKNYQLSSNSDELRRRSFSRASIMIRDFFAGAKYEEEIGYEC